MAVRKQVAKNVERNVRQPVPEGGSIFYAREWSADGEEEVANRGRRRINVLCMPPFHLHRDGDKLESAEPKRDRTPCPLLSVGGRVNNNVEFDLALGDGGAELGRPNRDEYLVDLKKGRDALGTDADGQPLVQNPHHGDGGGGGRRG